MMPARADSQPRLWLAAGVAAAVVGALFQFWGNHSTGYIPTRSLFYWWGFQWSNPGSDTEHGWLILGLSGWLLWRGVRSEGREVEGTKEGRGVEGSTRRGDKAEHYGADRKGRQEIAEGGGQPTSASFEGRPVVDPSTHRPLDSLSPWPALLALSGGLALHAVGFLAQQTRVSIGAFLLCAWGLLRLGGGPRWGRASAFPLAFMVFAIPINALDSIGFWLRVWVVDASGAIARASGIPVLQSGTLLVAPDGRYNYDVAAACSGIRSLTAMTALSLLAGYLNFSTWSRRTVVLLLCFPLVYVGNVARIVAIIFAAQAGGAKWGDIAHEVMGYGVFAIVLGGVLGGVALIRRWAPEASDRRSETGNRKPETGDSGAESAGRAALDAAGAGAGSAGSRPPDEGPVAVSPVSGLRSPVAAAAVAAVLALAEMALLHHVSGLPPRGRVGIALAAGGRDPVELPAFVGTEWIGRRAEVSVVERDILPPDTGYSRKNYVHLADPAQSVFCSIVLSGRDRTSIHRPELCLVGQGWTIADRFEHRFRDGRTSFPASVLRVRREVQTPRGRQAIPQLVAYWFVGGDAVVGRHWQMFLHDAWSRVAHARADRWAYLLLQTDATDGETAALARMQAVLDAVLPGLQPAGREKS